MKRNVKNRPKEFSPALCFLIELRQRLIYFIIFFFILFAILVYFANDLYTLLAHPLLEFLPQGHLIATQMVSPFFVPFKLSFMLALFFSAPYFIYQIWSFIAPALYKHERKKIWPFLFVSSVLFYSGNLFAYFCIFPLLFRFLAQVAPQGVAFSPDISDYLDFTTKLMLVFGGLFQIPIIILFLITNKIVTRTRLLSYRGYAIVLAFILGMLLAPPDVLSQTLLALPIWFLYEFGICLSYFFKESSS